MNAISLALMAEVLLSGAKAPEMALVIDAAPPPKEPEVRVLLSESAGPDFAKANQYWRFTVQGGRTVIYVREHVTGIAAAKSTTAMLNDLRQQGLGILAPGSPADTAARAQLRRQFNVTAPANQSNNVAFYPSLSVGTPLGSVNMGEFPRMDSAGLPAGKAEDVMTDFPDGLHLFNRGAMRLPQMHVVAYRAQGAPLPTAVWEAHREATDKIALAVGESQREVREAYDALESTVLPPAWRDLARQLPGEVEFDRLPDEVKQHLLNVAQRSPQAMGFKSTEEAMKWLEGKPKVQVRMNLMLMMRFRNEQGQIQGVGIAIGSGR